MGQSQLVALKNNEVNIDETKISSTFWSFQPISLRMQKLRTYEFERTSCNLDKAPVFWLSVVLSS